MTSPAPQQTEEAPQWVRLLVALLVMVPFVLRLGVVSRPPEFLVRQSPLLEDDLFYYLGIARHFIAGEGLRADAVTTTTGFQPLQLLWSMAVAAPFPYGSPAAVNLLLISQVLASFGALALLHRLVGRLYGGVAAGVASLMFAWWLGLVRHGNNGLETPLVFLALLVMAGLTHRFFLRPDAGAAWRLGLAMGAAVLCRIDLLAWAGAVALVALVAGRGRGAGGSGGMGILARLLFVPAAVLGGWLLVNQLASGDPLPDSGAAVRALGVAYMDAHLGGYSPLAAVRLAGAAMVSSLPLTQLVGVLGLGSTAANILGLGSTLLCGGLLVWRWRAFPLPVRRVWLVAAVFSAVVFAFYGLYVPGYWFFERYLIAIPLLTVLLVVPPAVALVRPRWKGWKLAAVAGLTLALYMAPTAARVAELIGDVPTVASVRPQGPEDTGISEVCHYADIARWLKARIPDDEKVAMWQGGMVPWLARREVYLMDGVVNREALRAWTSHRIDSWLVEEEVEWVVEFEGLMDVIRSKSVNFDAHYERIGLSQCGEDRASVGVYRRRLAATQPSQSD